ncbi:MAG: hypothetical protein A4E29_00176 [Methanomassiliicoccales archaeon PtaB.Bin134]|nr:MAG: hypothetical protein A4E29_00176 [Methanomassiliicoccales archaeon PtaB.Bin134]
MSTLSTASAPLGSTKYPEVSPMRHTASMPSIFPRPSISPEAPTMPLPGSPLENITPCLVISSHRAMSVTAPSTRGFSTILPTPYPPRV